MRKVIKSATHQFLCKIRICDMQRIHHGKLTYAGKKNKSALKMYGTVFKCKRCGRESVQLEGL